MFLVQPLQVLLASLKIFWAIILSYIRVQSRIMRYDKYRQRPCAIIAHTYIWGWGRLLFQFWWGTSKERNSPAMRRLAFGPTPKRRLFGLNKSLILKVRQFNFRCLRFIAVLVVRKQPILWGKSRNCCPWARVQDRTTYARLCNFSQILYVFIYLVLFCYKTNAIEKQLQLF